MRRYVEDPMIRWAFALATLVTLALNVPFYIDFKPHRGGTLALAIVASWVSTFCFFLLVTTHRVLLFTVLPVTLAACGAALYFFHELGVYVNENTLGLVYETSWGEAKDLLSAELVGYVVLAFGVGAAVAWLTHRSLPQSQTVSRLAVVGALFTTHFLTALTTRAVEVYDPPLGLFTNSYVYFRETGRTAELLKSRQDISVGAQLAPEYGGGEEYVVVFVVGETVRPDHLHINGYPRPTTPELERHEVLSFPDVLACAANTRFAVPCMLTRGTRADLRRPYEETSFVSVFRRLGFETSWISLQGKFWEGIVPDEYTVAATAAIAGEAEHVTYLNATGDLSRGDILDTDLIEPLDHALSGSAQRKLVVLHTAGAHFHYASHYPDRHDHYLPVCRAKNPRHCPLLDLNNAYDNAMHFQDEFLGSVIDRLKGKQALFFYVADHGESLGEGGQYLHHLGSSEPEQNRGAFFVWASDSFRKCHPEALAMLERNRTKKIAHEHVFHSVLDCAGVSAPVVDGSLSLCRDAQPRSDDLPPNRLSIFF